ncbi:HDOD domain protein [Caulifigura coniformis]|uniref:HDOD domain protein n=1 Tax=Caulifigura coniformis TaxID=2527983 RepID=A0A517SHL9_9PLAN|nr:HDOD domain-containing protein [Caulifigura coniformis]QDT55622.1 HDOD domain protein [Caulifigura coniformis]
MASAAESQCPEVPGELKDRLKRAVGTLNMLPAVAVQALQIANNPDCDLGKLAGVIQRDLTITTLILRMANSALFSPPKPIASLHHAMLSLGLRRCRDFIVTAGLDSVAKKASPEMKTQRETLWRHGFLTALFAMKINQLLGLRFQGEEFTAGLMHDFGRTLLAVADPATFTRLDRLDFVEGDDLEARESEAIGVSHAEFGAWFASTNELPNSLVAAIHLHHRPESAGEHLQLAALVAVADHMANHIQRGEAPEAYNSMTDGAMLLLEQSGARRATDVFAASVTKLLIDGPAIADSLMKE